MTYATVDGFGGLETKTYDGVGVLCESETREWQDGSLVKETTSDFVKNTVETTFIQPLVAGVSSVFSKTYGSDGSLQSVTVTLAVADTPSITRITGYTIEKLGNLESRTLSDAISELRGVLPIGWPLESSHGRIIENFGEIPVTNTRKTSLDYKNNHVVIEVSPNQKVIAVTAGTVVYSGSAKRDSAQRLNRPLHSTYMSRYPPDNLYVVIQHPAGYYTHYSNLTNVTVSENDSVDTGERIGYAAQDPNGDLPIYIRYGVTTDKHVLNPAEFLDGGILKL